jgi:hypothetical protein
MSLMMKLIRLKKKKSLIRKRIAKKVITQKFKQVH